MLICNHHLLTVTFPDLCWQKKVTNQSVGQNHKQNHKRTDVTIHETAWALFNTRPVFYLHVCRCV